MSFVPSILLAVSALALAAPLAAAETAPPRSISVTGQGEASGRPDLAEVNAGVQTFAPTVLEASRENQAIVDKIFAALKREGIAEKDIQTSNYSIWPQQDWPRGEEPQKPRITGYHVSNMVRVRLRDIDKIGDVLGAVTDAGANSINGIQFSVEDTDALEEEARRLAMNDARSRAESLASLAGVELGEVLSISMSSTPGYPRPYAAARVMEMADAGAPAPGIAPGEHSVTVNLHVTYAIR
jgi:uncharacterized protein YggE